MHARRSAIIVICCSLCCSACSWFNKSERHVNKPLVDVLLDNPGFESEGGWRISAPPDFSNYALFEQDQHVRKSGKRSGHILIERRHPKDGSEILHGWSQKPRLMPAGQKVRFGGWVRLAGTQQLHLGLEYEVATPRNGQTLFKAEVIVPPDDDRFHFVDRTFILPEDVLSLTFFAGIGSVGEVWFDNLYLFVVD